LNHDTKHTVEFT